MPREQDQPKNIEKKKFELFPWVVKISLLTTSFLLLAYYKHSLSKKKEIPNKKPEFTIRATRSK